MEFEEGSHQHAHDAVHDKGHHYEDVVAQLVVVFGYELVVEAPEHSLVKVVGHEDGGDVDYDKDIHKQK